MSVIIVGSGFAGLGLAIALKRAGRDDFVVLEAADALGGTWRDNHYPGCACDVPSHLYSYSFAPNPRWSRVFAPQREILAYLEGCATRYGLHRHIRYGAEVTDAAWDAATATWTVTTRAGARHTARHLALGVGGLSRPAIPAIEGLETFAGPAFHTARWDHGVDLAGKRVAVVGTGASAIQVVPQLAPRVAALDLYQRTPPWVLPKRDRAFTAAERALFAAVPAAARARRAATYWWLEARSLGFTVDRRVMEVARRMGLRHIRRQIRDPALRARVTPDYTPGCKRILMANDYYPALARDNVSLVTDPIARVTADGIVTAAGEARPVDALVLATGFRVTDLVAPMRVRGRDGADLGDAWRERPEAWLGTLVAGFPNLFVLTGPNTGLGHSSMVFMIEAQVQLILRLMGAAEAAGAAAVEVRAEAQRAYNAALAARLQRSVWASGCASWYVDASGHNATLWPGFTVDFWRRTRRPDLAAVSMSPAGAPTRVPTGEADDRRVSARRAG